MDHYNLLLDLLILFGFATLIAVILRRARQSAIVAYLLTGILVDRISYAPVFLLVALMPMLGTIGLFAAGRQYRHLDRPAEAMA